jgi:adenosylcobyric acid synthase
VGDIDRGGVFAQLVGTLELLEPEERALVKALVINKFRGDKSLLLPGLRFLEERTGLPVAGVVPYDPGLSLPEEDSVALEGAPRQGEGLLDVAALRLPRIANFDDLDPLRREAGVGLRFVTRGEELGRPDLLVIPGTKTTVADLEQMQASGLAEAVVAAVAAGSAVVGICGGFQMLGQAVLDPQGVESSQPQAPGLGLLPVTTVFRPAKTTHQVEARVEADRGLLAGCRGMLLRGYEIHMGQSWGEGEAPFLLLSRSGEACQVPDGALDQGGWVLGTYIHGLFHNRELRRRVLLNLARRKGVSLPQGDDAAADPYDRLAALVRAHLDLGLIYRLLGR